MNINSTIRDWALPIAMITGVAMYLLYVNIPIFDGTHQFVGDVVGIVQPTLIFLMLFVTFCKIKPSELRLSRWHVWLLLFQTTTFVLLSLSLSVFASVPLGVRVIVESCMMCLICPTATAAAVITAKLGGNSSSLISYTILINLTVSLVAPPFLTLSHPIEGLSFLSSFLLIAGKVFPLLLCPLVAAELLRHILPRVHRYIVQKGRNWPFLLWLVALSLAIAMTARAIAHSQVSLFVMAGIAIVSLVCCLLQFGVGHFVGAKYADKTTAGQALGQKNTVFAIWFAYTFLTPVTAIAGGFYSIWHNVVNTWQLYRSNHKK